MLKEKVFIVIQERDQLEDLEESRADRASGKMNMAGRLAAKEAGAEQNGKEMENVR